MNTTTTCFTKRMTLSIIIGLGFLLTFAPAVQAHKYIYRGWVVHDVYSAYDRDYAVPRWVRKDRGFRQWYLHSHYRYARRQNWHRLYDLYLYDRQMYRQSHSHHRSGKKYHGNVAPLRRHRH